MITHVFGQTVSRAERDTVELWLTFEDFDPVNTSLTRSTLPVAFVHRLLYSIKRIRGVAGHLNELVRGVFDCPLR